MFVARLLLLMLRWTDFSFFRHGEKIRISAHQQSFTCIERPPRRSDLTQRRNFFEKKCISRVDDPDWATILLTPPEAGLLKRKPDGVVFLHILGLQIGTQFCPGLITET